MRDISTARIGEEPTPMILEYLGFLYGLTKVGVATLPYVSLYNSKIYRLYIDRPLQYKSVK